MEVYWGLLMDESLAVTCGQQNWIEGEGDYDTGVCVSGGGALELGWH